MPATSAAARSGADLPSTPHRKSETLRRHLLMRIESELGPHDQLPTERDLAADFSVSRLTVRRVLDRLEQDGLVYRVQGSGTYVSEPRVAKSVELTSFTEDMRSRGMTPGSRVVLTERVPAGSQSAFALGISPTDEVVHLRRVRTADGEPMCLEDVYLTADLLPEDFALPDGHSLYRELADRAGLRPHHARQSIRVTVLDPEPAALLGVAAYVPAFVVERVVVDARGRCFEQARSLYRGDRYSYELSLFRDSVGEGPS